MELLVAQLAAEYHGSGTKVLIRALSAERIKALDQALWTFDPGSFLPHGTEEAGQAESQPVLLTAGGGNPNGAEALLLVDHTVAPEESDWLSIDYIFERSDPTAREAARQQWRIWKDQGHEPVYWQAEAQNWRRAG